MVKKYVTPWWRGSDEADNSTQMMLERYGGSPFVFTRTRSGSLLCLTHTDEFVCSSARPFCSRQEANKVFLDPEHQFSAKKFCRGQGKISVLFKSD